MQLPDRVFGGPKRIETEYYGILRSDGGEIDTPGVCSISPITFAHMLQPRDLRFYPFSSVSIRFFTLVFHRRFACAPAAATRKRRKRQISTPDKTRFQDGVKRHPENGI